MPIRLWSTVEILLQKPLSVLGRSKRREGAFTASAMARLLGSPQCLEEGDDLVDLVLLQPPVGHAGALLRSHRLHGRRVGHPPLQVLGSVLERRSSERRP